MRRLIDNDEITINDNEGVNINVASFSLLNSMYNVNKHTKTILFYYIMTY